MGSMQLLPPTASAHAADMDWLFAALIGTSVFILLLVFGLMILFCVRYRKSSKVERGGRGRRHRRASRPVRGLHPPGAGTMDVGA